jgi:hypothetical protein
MIGASILTKSSRRHTWMLASAILCAFFSAPPTRAAADDDLFQLAINYVLTGKTDPSGKPEIVDRKACVVVLPDPQFKRYVKYYLGRIRPDAARISKTYSGPKGITYVWEVESEGDNVVEYLNPDKSTVAFGVKTTQIALPGDIDQTEKAIRLIFSDYCKKDKPRLPF